MYQFNKPQNNVKKGVSKFMRFKDIIILFVIILTVIFAAPQKAFAITEQQEIEIGKQSAQKVEAQYGLWKDKNAVERLNKIGKAIADISERPNLTYSFKILNHDGLNALACPGGFVYVTKGAMKDVSDDELAFVLGHEIAHVAKRHSIKQIEKATATKTGLVIMSSLFNKGKISQGNLNVISAVNTVLSSGYSRKDERDADITGCHYMVKALNANPRAAVSFMQKLKAKGKEMPGFMNSIIGSHPMIDERISTLEEESKKMGY